MVSGVRRLPRPLLLARRRHEAGPPAGLDVGEHEGARLPPRLSRNSCCTCRCAPPMSRPPAGRPQMYRDVIAHPSFDSFWRAMSVREQLAQDQGSGVCRRRLVRQLRGERPGGVRRAAQNVGPEPRRWSARGRTTCRTSFADADFGPESCAPIRTLQLEWFDQWLMGKDSALLSQPPVKIFVMGANKWRDEQRMAARGCPPAHALPGSGGHANTLDGDGALDDRRPGQQRRRSLRLRPPRPRAHARRRGLLQPEGLSRGVRWTSVRWNIAATFWSTPPSR